MKPANFFLHLLLSAATVVQALPSRGNPRESIKSYKREPLQDVVTWDEHSIFVHGNRVLVYSGEFHPFRLAVPSLWLDVFQKIKAMGYNCVSFYTDWALLEGEPGVYREDGIFALDKFMESAKEAGIYLIARPGPYINAEASGGGFPGWLQRMKGIPRTTDAEYLNATNLYAQRIGESIVEGQITNGGPVILYQVENEYTFAGDSPVTYDPKYMQYVEDRARDAGIVVPFINNDITPPEGHNAPGTGVGEVDIYSHDSYPLGFDCSDPTSWHNSLPFPQAYRKLHDKQSPSSPYAILEYQGGSVDGWGGSGYGACAAMINAEAERLLYKTTASFVIAIQNIYMIYGGTNWGNLGQPNGYTSYDYGAVITEDRLVNREKYSEAKLIATFLQSSPDYLTATAMDNSNAAGAYSNNNDLFITQLHNEDTGMRLFIARHTQFSSLDSTSYTLQIPTSVGNLTLPRLGGSLLLNGRDAKIHVVDYNLGEHHLLYSTAEIFTWQQTNESTVLVVYGGPDEDHELSFSSALDDPVLVEGEDVQFEQINDHQILSWTTDSARRIVKMGDLFVYILDRSSAYNYWKIPTTTGLQEETTLNTKPSLIVKGGYLVRTANITESSISLTADINATTTFEIISGAPSGLQSLTINDRKIAFQQDSSGVVNATLPFENQQLELPDLLDLEWHHLEAIPEIQAAYDDSLWTVADIEQSPNDQFNQTTPISLSSSDYGYHTGSLIFRGHFNANGEEDTFTIHTSGGSAYSSSAWLSETYLGSWAGEGGTTNHEDTYQLPVLQTGKRYVITVLVDHMGMDMQSQIGHLQFKEPRGILDYELSSRSPNDIQWKLTGNLGGEKYMDKVRGPLNEGGFYPERQGFHYPNAPVDRWEIGSPAEGFNSPGARFYYTDFDLDIPQGYDVPLSFNFENGTEITRAVLYVNGYQFGKYVSNVGPQTAFPVPEGVLDYQGTNYIGILLWAPSSEGASLANFTLKASGVFQSGYGPVELNPMPEYEKRPNAY